MKKLDLSLIFAAVSAYNLLGCSMAAPEALPKARRIRFGPFRFDPHCGELSKGELKLKLQGQPIQLLSSLLERPGELVTRDELRQRLWPSDTFVDFEHSLNTAIRKLRQTLGDEAETPRFIETLPKRGYRFIGEILADEPSGPAITSTAPEHRTSHAGVSHRKLIFLGFIAAALVFWTVRGSRRAKSIEMVVTPLTSYPGGEWEPDLSPDGKMVAFVWDEGHGWRPPSIYVKMVSGNENAIRIAPPDSDCPAWSPDGNTVAFVYRADPQPGIYVAPPFGGTMKMLLARSLPYTCTLNWSPDGRSLLFEGVQSTPSSGRAIYRLDIRDQKITQITRPPGTVRGDFYAHFSPDGKSIAFARWTSTDVAEMYVVPSSGGEPRQLTHDNAIIRGLTWTANGKELLIASGRGAGSGGRLYLWRVGLNDGAMRRVPLPTFNASEPTISRTGSRLVFATGEWESDIWEVHLKNDEPEQKAYSSTLNDMVGSYSPGDGKVAFVSYRSGNAGLWVVNRDGSGAIELISERGIGSPRWSPDGKMIAYDAEPTANASLFVMSANGGTRRRLTNGEAKDVVPTWSHDSKWIYFSSNRTGVWQIFKMPMAGGEAAQVTKNGGLFAQESLDGGRLYFLRPEENAILDRNGPGIWVKSLVDGTETMVNGTERVQTRFFAVSRSGIYFVEYVSPRWALKLLDFRTGRIETLRSLNHDQLGSPSLALSPDENTLLYTSSTTDSDLMLVDNFR